MVGLYVLGCALVATLAAWVLLGGGESADARRVRASRAVRDASAWLLRVGSRAPVCLLSEFDSWRVAAEELVAAGYVRSLVGMCEQALALLAFVPPALGLAGVVVARSLVGVVVGVAAGVAAVPAWGAARARKRQEQLARQVPDTFRSLAGALGSGRTLSQAISYVGSQGSGPLQREFSRASLAVMCGVSATEAVEQIAERTQAPGVPLMVCALVVSARTGAPLHGLFARSARLVEARFELERELGAKTAQVRLSARIVSALPACMVGALALLSPDFRLGLATPVGVGCVCVATALDVVALAIIGRLMRGVL